MSDLIARHLLICGRVQGVYYRESMRQEAKRLGVVGWVRNRRDGSVEALIQGPAEAVTQLMAWARRGPPAAEVSSIEVSESLLTELSGFQRLSSL